MHSPSSSAHRPRSGDVITVLAAVYQAADAISRIAAADHEAVPDAARSAARPSLAGY